MRSCLQRNCRPKTEQIWNYPDFSTIKSHNILITWYKHKMSVKIQSFHEISISSKMRISIWTHSAWNELHLPSYTVILQCRSVKGIYLEPAWVRTAKRSSFRPTKAMTYFSSTSWIVPLEVGVRIVCRRGWFESSAKVIVLCCCSLLRSLNVSYFLYNEAVIQ